MAEHDRLDRTVGEQRFAGCRAGSFNNALGGGCGGRLDMLWLTPVPDDCR